MSRQVNTNLKKNYEGSFNNLFNVMFLLKHGIMQLKPILYPLDLVLWDFFFCVYSKENSPSMYNLRMWRALKERQHSFWPYQQVQKHLDQWKIWSVLEAKETIFKKIHVSYIHLSW